MGVSYQWAVKTLDPKVDKKSIDHALNSIGYIIMRKPEPQKNYYVVGFMYFGGYHLPHHAEIATPEQAEKLEEAHRRIYTRG